MWEWCWNKNGCFKCILEKDSFWGLLGIGGMFCEGYVCINGNYDLK